jgi:hypothetical protein
LCAIEYMCSKTCVLCRGHKQGQLMPKEGYESHLLPSRNFI